ncbi:MAG: outer membrane protein assembly factor BamE [Hyphomonadaceae bacterium]|nr:outer membrane protein assembly factor BamE [Hyphomonadaceae bacterium]
MNRGLLRVSAAAAVALASAVGACAPVQSYNGFRPDRNNVEIPDPQVGVDTRDTVMQRFGSPSTTAVFDQTSWYYVSAVQEQVAFYAPRITDRRVMVVRFDGDTVSAVEKYGIERGRVVAYNDEVTPTRGRELGVLEQLLGNVGNTSPIRTEEEERQRPGRR